MAGSYPDAPSRRMAYDGDGTVVLARPAAGATALFEASAGEAANINDEDPTSGWTLGGGFAPAQYWFLVFPELREFDGVYAQMNGGITTVDTSGDTTSTWDGTWTNRIADLYDGLAVIDDYRDNITSAAVSNVRAVRLQRPSAGGSDAVLFRTHVYGEISAGETPDRLLWFDNDDDLEFSKPQDYGDVPRGSAEDHVIYLKNNSASLSANTVQITAEDLFQGSGSWYTFNDGTGFAATKTLASSIGNGANSPDITIRRITPDAETLGVHAARAYANVGSWT